MKQLIEHSLGQEELFILYCCQGLSTNRPISAVDDLLTKSLDWVFIARMTDLHRIAGLIYLMLSQCRNITHVPASFLRQFGAAYHLNALRNLHFLKEFNEIAANFNHEKIRIIPLKGIEFLHSVYASNIGLRDLSDIDILVEKTKVYRAEKILLDMGYKRKRTSLLGRQNQFHSIFYRIRGKIPITIELHWDVDYSNSVFKMDIEESWKRSQEVCSGKIQYNSLSIEDNIIFNCLHIMRSAKKGLDIFWPLKNFCDIAKMITCFGDQINWHYIFQQSQAYKITRPLFFMLMLVQEMLSVKEIPHSMVAAIRKSGYRDEFGLCAVKEYVFSRQTKEKSIFPFLVAEFLEQKTLWGKIAIFRGVPEIVRNIYNAKFYSDVNHSVMRAAASTTWHYINKTFKTLVRYVFTPRKAILLQNKMTLANQQTKEVVNWLRG